MRFAHEFSHSWLIYCGVSSNQCKKSRQNAAMETPQAKRARTAGVDALSVTEMKSLIQSAGLSSKDCLEKSDLRKRSREALARLDEARRF